MSYEDKVNDFRAPDEISQKYQQQLTNIRSEFTKLEALWVKFRDQAVKTFPDCTAAAVNIGSQFGNLNNAIRGVTQVPNTADQQPEETAQKTY